MYAVIKTGGKQVRVEPGQEVQVEKIPGDVGTEVVFDRVLLFAGDDDNVKLGAPTLDGARVVGKVVGQVRGDKIRIYTYKRRQNSNRRTQGHRQYYTTVKIESIEA